MVMVGPYDYGRVIITTLSPYGKNGSICVMMLKVPSFIEPNCSFFVIHFFVSRKSSVIDINPYPCVILKQRTNKVHVHPSCLCSKQYLF